MRKLLTFFLSLCMACSLCLAFVACDDPSESSSPDEVTATEIENGGFETGDLSGWVIGTGGAFQDFGVFGNGMVDGQSVDHVGSYYFNGLEAGLQSFTGTLKSSVFKVSGVGHIAFLLGAMKDKTKSYVSVHLASDDSEIARQSNIAYDGAFITVQMMRYTLDLSAYKGQNVYIQINDMDKGDDHAYVLCDDFITCIDSMDVVDAYKAEYTKKYDELVPEVVEEDPTKTDIVNGGFETGDLSGWTILSGTTYRQNSVVPSTRLFWTDKEYYAEGDFFLNGYENGEDPKGAIRSTKFTLAGDGWISFLIGGSASPVSYVAICDENGNELKKVSSNTSFKDPEFALSLRREYVDMSAHIGKVIYIKVVDGKVGGPFGSISVDDFKVSLTQAQVQQIMSEQYKKMMELPNDSVGRYVKNWYINYNYPFELAILRFTKTLSAKAIFQSESYNLNALISENVTASVGSSVEGIEYGVKEVRYGSSVATEGFDSFDMTKLGNYTVTYYAKTAIDTVEAKCIVNVAKTGTILNGGFETGDLDGWTIIENENAFTPGSAIKESTYDTQDEGKAPYNNGGVYHFDGREAQRDLSEASGFVIRSTAFILGGSGHISFKLGGRTAAVYVYTADGTRIARYINTEFNDQGHPLIEQGARLATMTTYLADLSAYLGQELYLEIVDEPGGNWGNAWFDDIVVYYETAPVLADMYDTVYIYRSLAEGGSGKWHLSSTPEEFKLAWKEAVNVPEFIE